MAVDPISNTSNPRPTVCVVEPDAGETDRIAASLEPLGAVIRAYPDGGTLLADPADDAICVISEMALPDMSGAELIAALRQRGNSAPVILLAAESDVAAAVAGIRAGALDYIEKAQLERLLPAHVRSLMHDSTPGTGLPEE